MDKLATDICIIGAGSGGLTVAAVCSQMGAKVILIERDKMGGECLNSGCVPSKALIESARHAYAASHANKFGLENTALKADYKKIAAHIQTVIDSIAPHDSIERFTKFGVSVIKGYGKFIDENTVQVNDNIITAKYFVVATGSAPFIPPIDGLDKTAYFTNETIFALDKKPKHLICIGGGPIGCELAAAHHSFATAVTIIDAGSILPRDDQECVAIVKQRFIDDGITLKENSKILKVEQIDENIIVTIEINGTTEQLTGSHLLVATGRKANIDYLQLDKANIDFDRTITVDKRMRTTNLKVFAIGDSASGPQFTHAASFQAGVVIRNIIFKWPAKINYASLPWCTYINPELAHVGLTEQDIKSQRIKYRTIKVSFSENDRAQADHATDGIIKAIIAKNGKILGVDIVGPHAGELISLWSFAIANGLKIKAMANFIAPYPTLNEISKRVASEYYASSLYSNWMRFIVKILMRFVKI